MSESIERLIDDLTQSAFDDGQDDREVPSDATTQAQQRLRTRLAEQEAELGRLREDAARYEWLAEHAVIETEEWRHDGRDPASTKQPLDAAIDAAIAQGDKA